MGRVVIIDTSVLLSLFFDEPLAPWCAGQLNEHASVLAMSTVNLAETLIRVRDRYPEQLPKVKDTLETMGIRYVAPDVEQATIAADARHRYPFNLGDCFVYALAKVEDLGILTLDLDFRAVDCPVTLPKG